MYILRYLNSKSVTNKINFLVDTIDIVSHSCYNYYHYYYYYFYTLLPQVFTLYILIIIYYYFYDRYNAKTKCLHSYIVQTGCS